MESDLRVIAVIVTYNNATMLAKLIHDLLSQTYPLDQIIVVDNSSTDSTLKLLKDSFPKLSYVRMNENTGSAGGYYEGIKAAHEACDLIWTLDDDVRLEKNSLEKLVEGLKELDSTLKVSSVRSVGEGHPYTFPTRLEFFPWCGTLVPRHGKNSSLVGNV